MAKYMLNICYGDQVSREGSTHPNDDAFVMNQYREWSQRIGAQTLVAHKLRDGEGRKLTWVAGKIQDGPYTETKESIGGFYIVEAKDYSEAVELAGGCPTLRFRGGYVEIRAVEI